MTEALAASAAVGDAPRATAARAGLALLELAEGKPAAAVPLARDAAAWYTAHGMAGEESRALALLAEALLGKGELAAARQAAARARAGVAQSDDRELRIVVAARVARVDAAAGAAPRALQELRQAIEEAGRLGLGEAALEARLALGEIQLGRPGQDGAEGRSTLAAVRVDAARRGFALVARRAAGPLPAGVRPLG